MFTIFGLIFIVILLVIFDRYAFKNQKLMKTASQFSGPFAVPIFGNAIVNLFRKPEGGQKLFK